MTKTTQSCMLPMHLIQLCPTRPSRGFCVAQFSFRCSKSILHTDSLSVF